MANISIGQIIIDAQRLANRVKDLDALGNALLVEAEGNNRALETMRQFQDDIDSLNKLARNKSNSDMINRINQQNPSIREIRQENRELKASLEDHQRALEIIMHKYREHTQHKVFQSRLNFKELYNEKLSEIIREQADKISEMAAVMQKAASIDDEAIYKEIEWMHKLKVENQGLREVLKIANEFGSTNVSIPNNRIIFSSQLNNSMVKSNETSKSSYVSDTDKQLDKQDIEEINDDATLLPSTSTSIDECKLIDSDSDSDSIITLAPNGEINSSIEENDVGDHKRDRNFDILCHVDLFKTIKKQNGKFLNIFRESDTGDVNKNEENFKEIQKTPEKLQTTTPDTEDDIKAVGHYFDYIYDPTYDDKIESSDDADDENNINETIKIKTTTKNLNSNEIKEETIAS